MARLTPEQLFGDGFYQDAEVIRIQKSALPRLTASPYNTAQSLLVALILLAASNFSGYLQDQNGEVLRNENNQPLEFDNSALYEALVVSFWRAIPQKKYGVPVIIHTFLIEFFASASIPYDQPITPDDL
jgi:hypothetical protein